MAVIIDMKMPESCCLCPLAEVYANRVYYLSANKPIWCPIRPIDNTQKDCEGCEAMEQYEENKRGATHITNIFM